MKNGIRVTIEHDNSYDYYYMYSLTLGNHIGGMFDTKQDAIDAAESCGMTVVERSDLPSMETLVLDDHDYSVLLWWLEVCDFECVRTIFDELLYHEACIRRDNADGRDMGMLVACGMSVSSALALESIARDLNRGYKSEEWIALANWKLDQMAKEGVKTVRCDLGSVELAV